MYKIANDTRIFMCPVTDYDNETRSHVLFPGGKERVFRDERELIRYLAVHTDTHGCADPARWTNEVLSRQFAKGRPARTWTIRLVWYDVRTERWDYWFHDANGRTVDVRLLWPEVVKAVRAGVKEETPIREFRCILWKKMHTSVLGGQRGRYRAILRAAEPVTLYDEEDNVCGRMMPRKGTLNTARYVRDWDWFRCRARHSTGWKEHKQRYQWEHKVLEREKHEKNRLRKERKRTER